MRVSTLSYSVSHSIEMGSPDIPESLWKGLCEAVLSIGGNTGSRAGIFTLNAFLESLWTSNHERPHRCHRFDASTGLQTNGPKPPPQAHLLLKSLASIAMGSN